MAQPIGRFKGELIAKFADYKDGKLITLLEDFTYEDSFGLDWTVPKGWKSDGATIPRVLWTFGSPLTGLYVRASVIHDYFCDTRSRPWGAVHNVFYEAMLASGVSPLRAKIMYAGVCWGGPRWSYEIVNSYEVALADYVGFSNLPGRIGSNRLHYPSPHEDHTSIKRRQRIYLNVFRYPITERDLKLIEFEVEKNGLKAEDVPNFCQGNVSTLEPTDFVKLPVKS